jgi:tetratricopeptide (TPR) repeat protein
MAKALRPCATCGKIGAAQKCPCSMASYCGPECQKSHWQVHKETCTVSLIAKTKEAKDLHGKDSIEAIEAQYMVGKRLIRESKFQQGEKYLIKCKDACKRLQLDQSSDEENRKLVIQTLTDLGTTYMHLGKRDLSVDTLHDALDLAKGMYSTDHVGVVQIVIAIGHASGQPEFLERVAQLDMDAECHTTASLMYNLAHRHIQRKEYGLAMTVCTKVLAYARKNSHQRLLGLALSTTGRILICEDKIEEALHSMQEALPILRIEFGEKSRYVVDALGQLGWMYIAQDKIHEAIKVYKKAIRYSTDACFKNTEVMTRNVIVLYSQQNKFAKILEFLRKDEVWSRSVLVDYDEILVYYDLLDRER